MANAEQRADQRVTSGLHQDALAGVDQDDRELRGRGAGRHVAGILLVARRVGDHEGAPRRGEKPIGDVDGDALLAFGLQPIDEQGKVRLALGRAVPRAVGRKRLELIVMDRGTVVQQSADQRRLAVVDRSAGQEAQ